MPGARGAPSITAAGCASGRTLASPPPSPDAARVAMVAADRAGVRLAVVAAGGGPEEALAVDPAPAVAGGSVAWRPDGAAVLYTSASGLHEVGIGGGRPRLVLAGAVSAPAPSPDGDRVAVIVDERDVVVVTVATGDCVTISGGNDFALDPAWSPAGDHVVWHEWNVPAMPWDGGRIARAPADGSAEPVTVAGGDGVAVGQPRFSPDGARLGYLCDRTGWYVLWIAAADGSGAGPLLDEPREHATPAWGSGLGSWVWSPDDSTVAHLVNDDGFGCLRLTGTGAGGTTRLAGRGVHGDLSWYGNRLVALRSGARTPDEVVVYDTGALGDAPASDDRLPRRSVARGPAALAEAALVEPEVVGFRAADGTAIVARLYRPPAPRFGSPPPLLLSVHGGPTGQTLVDFRARVAFFVDRGWAVLVPDFRGSTGHGRAFAQALRGRWGELDVADCADALAAAAARRWGDPERLVPIGTSSGGLTVLLLLARHPERVAAGVAISAVADIPALDETTHRFEAHYNGFLVGDPAVGAARSPIASADRIRGPLLVLHGDADEVVPVEQARRLVAAVRAAGGAVEHHEYAGQGHGWHDPAVVEDELERIDSFLRRHVLESDG